MCDESIAVPGFESSRGLFTRRALLDSFENPICRMPSSLKTSVCFDKLVSCDSPLTRRSCFRIELFHAQALARFTQSVEPNLFSCSRYNRIPSNGFTEKRQAKPQPYKATGSMFLHASEKKND